MPHEGRNADGKDPHAKPVLGFDVRKCVAERRKKGKHLYNRKNMYNLESSEDELDFVQREEGWQEARDDYRQAFKTR